MISWGAAWTTFRSFRWNMKRLWATLGRRWKTIITFPGKFRDVMVVGEKLSAVCDYNVAQYKIKTYENRHVRDGADFKGVEGVVTQIECPPEEPLAGGTARVYQIRPDPAEAAGRRLGRLRRRPSARRRPGIRPHRPADKIETVK